MARGLDPRETPWHGKPHSRELQASVPADIADQLEAIVKVERERRGKFSKSAAVREAVDLWLYARERS